MGAALHGDQFAPSAQALGYRKAPLHLKAGVEAEDGLNIAAAGGPRSGSRSALAERLPDRPGNIFVLSFNDPTCAMGIS